MIAVARRVVLGHAEILSIRPPPVAYVHVVVGWFCLVDK